MRRPGPAARCCRIVWPRTIPMTTIHTKIAMFLTQNDNRPSQASGPVDASAVKAAGASAAAIEQIEVRHPRFEDRLILAIPVDRQRQQQALRDQIGNQNGEGEPREIVQQLGQLRRAFRAEGAEEPEHVRDEKQRGRAAGAGDQAVGHDRRAVSHPANLHRQQDHDGDQTHAEPVEQDHAVANPRGLIAIESSRPPPRAWSATSGAGSRETARRRIPR